MPLAYALVEGSVVTTLVLEAGEPTGRITVYERDGGVDVVPPESFVGRLEADAFVYPDGSRLALTAETLTWPEGSALAGAVFRAAPLPEPLPEPRPAG